MTCFSYTGLVSPFMLSIDTAAVFLKLECAPEALVKTQTAGSFLRDPDSVGLEWG